MVRTWEMKFNVVLCIVVRSNATLCNTLQHLAMYLSRSLLAFTCSKIERRIYVFENRCRWRDQDDKGCPKLRAAKQLAVRVDGCFSSSASDIWYSGPNRHKAFGADFVYEVAIQLRTHNTWDESHISRLFKVSLCLLWPFHVHFHDFSMYFH
jgi:hypothetical protein